MIGGILLLIIGVFIGFPSGNGIVILLSVVGGLLLMGVSKLIAILEQIYLKVLQQPFTYNQVSTIIKNSNSYFVESESFHVYPEDQAQYPLIYLDGDYYMRARVFMKYLSQNVYEYTFSFPDQAPITLNRLDYYEKGVELFAFEDQVIVLLNRLNLKPVTAGGDTLRLVRMQHAQ